METGLGRTDRFRFFFFRDLATKLVGQGRLQMLRDRRVDRLHLFLRVGLPLRIVMGAFRVLPGPSSRQSPRLGDGIPSARLVPETTAPSTDAVLVPYRPLPAQATVAVLARRGLDATPAEPPALEVR